MIGRKLFSFFSTARLNRSLRLGLLGAGLLCLGIGCNSQPRVSSSEAMELIKQAYTACNTKNSQRLAATETRYEELVAEGVLSESERRAFEEILDLARAGNWEKAQARAFSFAKSQTR